MSAGGARRGRRDNGIDAAEFAVAGDVDPRVGEHLLDVLAAGGIAAYLQPASDLNPITRTTIMPARPTDRLFVDRAHLGTARDYLARLAADEDRAGSGGSPTAGAGSAAGPDIDAEWARIIAGFHTEVDPATRPWPAAEHLDRTGTEPPGRTGTEPPGRTGTDVRPTSDGTGGTLSPPGTAQGPGTTQGPAGGSQHPSGGPFRFPGDVGRPADPGRPGDPPAPADEAVWARPIERRRQPQPATPDEPSLLDALDTFGMDLPGEPADDEGYTPPPPPPLPQFSKFSVAGVIGMVGGFILFVFPHLVPLEGDVVMLFGFTCILAGFVTLIWRLRPGDEEEDDDPENGAVV